MALSTAEITRFRAAVRDVETLAQRDLTRLWRQFDLTDATQVRDALADTLPDLIGGYHLAAGAVAADWYDLMRLEQEVPGRFQAIIAEGPTRERATALAGWGVGPLFGATDGAAAGLALSKVAGGLQRTIADGARSTIVTSAFSDPARVGWSRVTSGGCDFCLMLARRGAVYRSEDGADFASHDHCFPAGVTVTGPSVELAYRRWYQGELVIIGMAGGEELPVTPNHPILTSRGWVEAGLLSEGDDVVQRSRADLASLDVPHEDDVPAPIQHIWGAAGMNLLRSVPVAAEDFHGDGGAGKGYVDVVASHGFLTDVLDALAGELLAEIVGSRTGSTAVLDSFTAGGYGLLPSVGSLGRPDCGMGCARERTPFLVGHATESEFGGLGLPSNRQSSLTKPARDHSPRHPEPGRHRQNALAGLVGGEQLGGRIDAIVRRLSSTGSRYNPPAAQGDAERLRVMAELGGNLLERLSGGVQLSRVVKIRRVEFAGHVFNLQTVEGWFAANSVVVSNCKCDAVPEFGEAKKVRSYTPSQRFRTQEARDANNRRLREHLRDRQP